MATPLASSDCSPTCIDCDILNPGRDPPIENAACILDNKVIEWVGIQSQVSTKDALLTRFHVRTLLPGLWDTHTHYYGARRVSIDALYNTLPALAGARVAHDLHTTLNAGFTSVRELGGRGHQVAEAVAEGSIIGPTISSAVSPISMTAARRDAHGVRLPALQQAIDHVGLPLHLCDGVPDCIKAVRQQMRQGASLIQVCASGGCTSQGGRGALPR